MLAQISDLKPEVMRVELDEIDSVKRPYDVSYGIDDGGCLPTLLSSIDNAGVINPVRLLFRGGGSYLLISGRRRVNCARTLGHTDIPALVFDRGTDGIDDRGAMTLALLDNIPLRHYSAVESSWIVNRLVIDFGVGEDDIIDKFFPLINLAPSRGLLTDLIAIWGLEGEIKEIAHRRDYPLKLLVRWLKFPTDDTMSIYSLVSGARFGSGAAVEVMNIVREITIRDEIPVEEILKIGEVDSILQNEAITPNEKVERIREALRRLRYPNLHRLEGEFARRVSALKITRGEYLTHPPYFEGDFLSFSLKFKDTDELKRMGESIVEMADEEDMEKLVGMV